MEVSHRACVFTPEFFL